MYSKLVAYLVILQLSIISAEVILNPEFLTLKQKDHSVLKQAFKDGKKCNVYPLIKAAEYLAERYEEESNPDHKMWLHQSICLVYLACPLECARSTSRHEMMLALQQQLLAVQKKELAKLEKKYGISSKKKVS